VFVDPRVLLDEIDELTELDVSVRPVG